MSYDALRKGRHSLHHQNYCITAVTRDRSPLFTDFTTARLLIHELRRLHETGDVNSIAWVVMPDHLHWLLQLNDSSSLSGVMKAVKARSARTINRHLHQGGSLWQRHYYDRAIRQHEDIRQISRYIVANPLRAGLVQNIGDYCHWDCIWMDGTDGPIVID